MKETFPSFSLRCGRPVALAAVLAVLVLALGGCVSMGTRPETAPGTPPETRPRSAPPPVNLTGYSAAFKAGFADGCETARGNARRDEQRFAAESQYARGWQDGKAICGKR